MGGTSWYVCNKLPHNNIGVMRSLRIDHCIEMIRLSLTCSSDMRLYTFFWPKNSTKEFRGSYADMTRDCVDWRELEKWSSRRGLPNRTGVELPEEDAP